MLILSITIKYMCLGGQILFLRTLQSKTKQNINRSEIWMMKNSKISYVFLN